MTLSEQIKALRQSMGLSRDDFGGLYKVSSRTVEAWEQGLRTPSGFILKDIEKKVKETQAVRLTLYDKVVVFPHDGRSN